MMRIENGSRTIFCGRLFCRETVEDEIALRNRQDITALK
jgi:hypothetical protein